MTKTFIVTSSFSAAHFYRQKKWSSLENQICFGKCFTEYGHGHNYRLEVGFQTPQALLLDLQQLVKAITDPLDHQHLNFVIAEFKDLVPTTENIAKYLLKKLHEGCPNEFISYIKLYEMDDLWVEIRI
ncbi:MAG TPA: 6-carboxytetrahydropterin synthase [Pseudobdellovibrionaceae bacterium]|jgi:6-pyruvoyltetrahydropterin/6-carboxytetrahydropterin synthase